MTIAVDSTKNTLAAAYAAAGTWISVHTASPGSTGANEVTGGSPAYARKQTTWGTPTAGVVTGTEVTIDVPAGAYTHWGLWSAQTGGTFRDGGALTPSATVGGQTTIKVPISYTQT